MFPTVLSSFTAVFSLSLVAKRGGETLVMFAVPTAFFGSQTKSTAGAQAYRIYSKHSRGKGQLATGEMLIIQYSAAGRRKVLRVTR